MSKMYTEQYLRDLVIALQQTNIYHRETLQLYHVFTQFSFATNEMRQDYYQ